MNPTKAISRFLRSPVACCAVLLLLAALTPGHAQEGSWEHDPRASGDHFPIAVWLQHPSRAERYAEAGFNLYVGLWQGPTEEQLDALRKAGMPVLCAQNEVGLAHAADPIIQGWLQDDEPDNAQSLGKDQGYGPPVTPAQVVSRYDAMRAADPTRPVVLNLGQGVAWDGWRGRGTRRNHPEDYPQYSKGADIVSFDIYPVVHRSPEVAGDITYVARGIDRLREWTNDTKHVWNCIECTHIQNAEVKPTPQQVRAEVWLSLVHGSRGLIYFVHEWQPRFNEKALLDDAEMLAAVTKTNRQIHELAAVINSPSLPGAATVTTEAPGDPIHWTVRCHDNREYLFAVNTTGQEVDASVHLTRGGARRLEHLDAKPIYLKDGHFTATFAPYAVHLYRRRSDCTR